MQTRRREEFKGFERNKAIRQALLCGAAWLDPLHFHFSHHVEHHLFPKMGSDQAPKVRAWLQREMPDRYVCPSHARALAALYRTPRVYQDAHTLVDPLDRSRTVDVMALQGELR